MSCPHDIDPEYLHRTDVAVMDVYEEDGTIRVSFGLPCPDCGEALVLDSAVERVEEGEFDLPLDDDPYD